MTIEQTDVIDIISTAGSSVILTISDHLDWEDEASHVLALQDKLNAYLAFIESGELFSAYPQAEGKSPVIQVIMRAPPSPGGREFLERVRPIVEGAGFGWRFRVHDPETPPS